MNSPYKCTINIVIDENDMYENPVAFIRDIAECVDQASKYHLCLTKVPDVKSDCAIALSMFPADNTNTHEEDGYHINCTSETEYFTFFDIFKPHNDIFSSPYTQLIKYINTFEDRLNRVLLFRLGMSCKIEIVQSNPSANENELARTSSEHPLIYLLTIGDQKFNVNDYKPPSEYTMETYELEVSKPLFNIIKGYMHDINNIYILFIEGCNQICDYFAEKYFVDGGKFDDEPSGCYSKLTNDEECIIDLNKTQYFSFYIGEKLSSNAMILRFSYDSEYECLLLYQPSNEYQSFMIDDDGATEEIHQIVFLDNGKVFDCYERQTGPNYISFNEDFIRQTDIRHSKAIITIDDDCDKN